jgi:Pentapeptide repeats (8 copies)
MEATMHDEPINRVTRDISSPESKPESQDSSRRIVIVVLVLLAAAILLALVLWGGPSILTRHPTKGLTAADRLKAESDVRTALVAMIIALGALAGLVFTALNLRVSQQTLRATFQSLEDARAAQRGAEEAQRDTLRLQRESQIAERYTRAVEQLGNREASDVRTGAVYALEQIASDSPEQYHQPVVEMLAAFLREHADKTHGPAPDAIGGPPRSSADLIAALEVLGRRHDVHLERRPLDLRRIRVVGAYLDRANLHGAILNGAVLPGTSFEDAFLEGASLSDADLSNCDFNGADLSGALLDDADLRYVRWTNARLTGTMLHGARYERSRMTESQLTEAVEGD